MYISIYVLHWEWSWYWKRDIFSSFRFNCCNIGFYITSTKLFIIVTSAVTSHYNNVCVVKIFALREKKKKKEIKIRTNDDTLSHTSRKLSKDILVTNFTRRGSNTDRERTNAYELRTTWTRRFITHRFTFVTDTFRLYRSRCPIRNWKNEQRREETVN